MNAFEDFRQSVINYRIDNGLTQAELADKCGVSRVTISNIECKEYHRPNLVTIHKVSRVIKKTEEKEND